MPPYLKRKAFAAGEQAPATEDDPARWAAGLPAELLSALLAKVVGNSGAFRRIGYTLLYKMIAAGAPAMSEYYVKKCLKTMQQLGYIEVGKAKQGTRITEKGVSLLSSLQGHPH